jgi:acyl dehydratase
VTGPARVDLADLGELIGTEVGPSAWVVIDQARINAFGDATEDRQWIHTDPTRAAGGPFGGTIAHGYLTVSLISHFLFELLVVDGVGSTVNYGLDRLRFPAPVPAGSRVRATASVQSVEPVTGGVQAKIRVTIERDGGDRPVCVADVLTRFLP